MTDQHDLYDPTEHEPLPEGEEAAPPLTHTMAIVRWVILGGMTLFALIMVLSYFGATPWAGNESSSTQYHCPMHPTYISSQPGDCPICGMSLVPIDAKVDADSAAHAEHGDENASGGQGRESVAKPGQYYCPMDPEVASDSEGRCPMCGMFLEKFEPGMKFTCEMHPEVVTDKPGDCPKCGMDLIPLSDPDQAAQEERSADLGQAPVPGLVPVTIEPRRLQLIGVRNGLVERRSLADETRLVGYVTPDESRVSSLNIRISGWVQKLSVNQTGQEVSAGQELLTVYSQDLYQAQQDFLVAAQTAGREAADPLLATTRNQILGAARERLQLLGTPEDEIRRLETTGQPRAELPLQSPFAGIVLEKAVNVGQFVGPDRPLFVIADLRKVWVLADVYETDLSRIRSGQKAIITLTAFPGEEFPGTVGFIYPTISQETRTLKVRFELDNPNMKLRPGMYADVRLQSAQEPVLAIPRDAIMDGGHMAYAFVIHNGTHFEPRLITTGRTSDEYVEVLSGLTEGELVVTSANFLIDSESRLQAAISGMGGTAADAHTEHGK